ncbi:hypothetical protein JOD64_005473 [Micromonospora luteifusca]|uniref:Uncharacterized protein n=1 Tax=Micromonospora luteifusca TaxID=709860 RepID=A0ABS2M1F5_9ACTN|nr:hypothetical protein [Micromonospora luteifusca]
MSSGLAGHLNVRQGLSVDRRHMWISVAGGASGTTGASSLSVQAIMERPACRVGGFAKSRA